MRCTYAATPSFPLPPTPSGHATAVLEPTFSFHSGLAFRSEEHTSELQSQSNLVCRLLLEKKNDAYKKVLHPISESADVGSPQSSITAWHQTASVRQLCTPPHNDRSERDSFRFARFAAVL